MNILLLFATYSGGTQTVANFLQSFLEKNGHSVTIKNPKATDINDVLSSELTLLCSPSWDINGKEGQPHEDYFLFMEKTKGVLFENKNFAIIGLGDSSYSHFCGAVNILEAFIKDKKGVLKIPSLRIDGFFYDEDKHIKTVEEWIRGLL